MADIIQKKQRLKEVSKLIQGIDIDKLTPDQYNAIAKMLIIDKVKAKLDLAVKKELFDYTEKKALFLKSLRTDNTRKVYSGALKHLEDYLNNKDLSILDADSYIVDDFVTTLNVKSNSTARIIIAGCSKFFSMLKRWNVLTVNYFLGCSLPKQQRPGN